MKAAADILKNFLKEQYILLLIMFAPTVIFIFTLGRYYGFYCDNHYFNLLALDLLGKFKFYVYLGSHYSICSSLFSYILYPVFIIFGPTDLSIELVASLFHLLTIFICFKLGSRFYNRATGFIFASLAAIAPMQLINIYTWQELSFSIFLNTLSIYLFLSAFQELSRTKLIISALLYSISCFNKVYSLLLLPFFIIYSLIQMVLLLRGRQANIGLSECKDNRILNLAFYFISGIAFLYLILLAEAVFIETHRSIFYIIISLFLVMVWIFFRRLPLDIKKIVKFCSIFVIVVAVVLLWSDLFVQLDMHFFNQRFGYYRDTAFVGGPGTARPLLYLNNRLIQVFDKYIFSSVLSSLLVFKSFYTRASLNPLGIIKILVSYYQKCLPPFINFFLIIGIIGLLAKMPADKNDRFKTKYLFPIAWLLAMTLSFVNSNEFHIMRAYLLPVPYLFAALGVYTMGILTKNIVKKNNTASNMAMVAIVLVLNWQQLWFSINNIYRKYKYDKSHSNYYQLFHGWNYGRSYKEAGEFLLKDAPLKKDGKFRSIFIYTIASDTAVNICAIFYNAIDWYTQNKIKIVYDPKYISRIKYGSALGLRQYLYDLFYAYPDVEAIYFADFYDTKDNFSFFSKIHRDIIPYKVVNDDDMLDYDCMLYKFERDKWRNQLK